VGNIWKKTAVALFKTLSRILPEETEENQKKKKKKAGCTIPNVKQGYQQTTNRGDLSVGLICRLFGDDA
jgi:hypothetical protein